MLTTSLLQIYPRLATVIACLMSCFAVLDGERRNAYRICEDAYQKRVTWMTDVIG